MQVGAPVPPEAGAGMDLNFPDDWLQHFDRDVFSNVVSWLTEKETMRLSVVIREDSLAVVACTAAYTRPHMRNLSRHRDAVIRKRIVQQLRGVSDDTQGSPMVVDDSE